MALAVEDVNAKLFAVADVGVDNKVVTVDSFYLFFKVKPHLVEFDLVETRSLLVVSCLSRQFI